MAVKNCFIRGSVVRLAFRGKSAHDFDVRVDNERARTLYESLGFERIGDLGKIAKRQGALRHDVGAIEGMVQPKGVVVGLIGHHRLHGGKRISATSSV